MQIGAFAHLCDTKLSVLRHYDKERILMPAYVDPVTGYRHYTPEQADVFRRITALKRAGFSLAEIRRVLSQIDSDEAVFTLFDAKEAQLRDMLSDLSQARAMMENEKMRLQITVTEENNTVKAISAGFDSSKTDGMKQEMDEELLRCRYQRISGYTVCTDAVVGESRLSCAVCRLNEHPVPIFENTDLPFEDDPLVIGRWDVVGEFAHRDDIPENPDASANTAAENGITSLYFLPGGEDYWCYAWTRGKLLCRYGDGAYVCTYTTECIDGVRYMIVDWKSYEYRCGGRPVALLLRQHDTNHYTKEGLARKDNIDLPFEDDPRVIGAWHAVGMVSSPTDFQPEMHVRDGLFFSEVTFAPGGTVTSQYGSQTVCGEQMQVWTRGYILRKWNSTACAYEIRMLDGTEYLFVEWKSGDYTWGGRAPKYYVFVRDSVTP